MRVLFQIAVATSCIGLANCAIVEPAAEVIEPSVISLYTQAYNARDIEEMSALMHPDIQWLSVEGDEIVVFANGRPDLVKQMSAYMSSSQATTSSIADPIMNGAYHAVKETASWQRSDGTIGQQAAIAIYELSDGLVRRVWYYPAEEKLIP